MEPIAKTLSTYRPESSLTLSRPLSLPAVEHIFDSLKGQLGAKVADLWGSVKPEIIEREWASGLAGFRKHELQRGIDACSDRIFAPTLGEFKNLCRPCLNPEWAWLEAGEGLRERADGRMGDWTHPAVFFAAISMSYEVQSGDWKRHRTRWTRAMGMELAKGWRTIPEPPQRIAHEEHVGPPPDHVRANIARLLKESKERAARLAAEQQLKEQEP